MSSITINGDSLGVAVKAILDDECERIKQAQREVTLEVANDAVEELKHAGDFGGTKYRKSWAVQPETVSGLVVAFTVHNKKHYQLTHLLEDGHVKANQYGTYGHTRAFKHIKPTADKMQKIYEKRLEEVAQG